MPDREPFDPLAALRAMGDVQRAGLEAAASVVELILELGRHGARMPYSFHLPAQPLDGNEAGTRRPIARVRCAAYGRMATVYWSGGANGCVSSSMRRLTAPRRASPSGGLRRAPGSSRCDSDR